MFLHMVDPIAVVSMNYLGGYGDILASRDIYTRLKSEGIPTKLHFSSNQARTAFLDINGNSYWEEYVPEENQDIITIYRTLKMKNPVGKVIANITISEYGGLSFTHSNYEKGDIHIMTGLGFNERSRDIQAGIYPKDNLTRIMEARERDGAQKFKRGCLSEIYFQMQNSQAILRERGESYLSSNWSFLYQSTLENKGEFFDVLSKGDNSLENKLVVFSVCPNEESKEKVKQYSMKKEFNYVNLVTEENIEGDSNITVLETGKIPHELFLKLLANADSLSVVTGSGSLSEMIQLYEMGSGAPFLYHQPPWKRDYGKAFVDLISARNKKSGELFERGISLFSGKAQDQENVPILARLLYDKRLIKTYVSALKGIKRKFIEKRKDSGIVEAEKLWSVSNAVATVVRNIQSGFSIEESVEGLIVPQ